MKQIMQKEIHSHSHGLIRLNNTTTIINKGRIQTVANATVRFSSKIFLILNVVMNVVTSAASIRSMSVRIFWATNLKLHFYALILTWFLPATTPAFRGNHLNCLIKHRSKSVQKSGLNMRFMTSKCYSQLGVLRQNATVSLIL
jgi:hypothetical protein